MCLIFVSDGGVSGTVRMNLISKRLRKVGYDSKCLFPGDSLSDVGESDIVIFSRPSSIEAVEYAKKHAKAVVADTDDYFRAIPQGHPGYNTVGPGDPSYIKRTDTCIEMANLATFSTKYLRDRMGHLNNDNEIIPNGYDEDNYLWDVEAQHEGVIIGWAGTITHREDIRVAIPSIKRALKRFPNAKFMVCGDIDIAASMDLKPSQLIFMPPMSYEDYPYFYAVADIWLVPLVVNEFNKAKSDIKLVEAGAAGIPWIATDIEPYKNWGTGGLLCSTSRHWDEALMDFIPNRNQRILYGNQGHQKSMGRTSNEIANKWVALFENRGWL